MKTMKAGGTIRRSRFVKPSTTENNTCLEADANEAVIGISQIGGREAPLPSVTADPPQAAQDGDHVHIHTNNTECEDVVLEIGSGGITAGAWIKSDADGKGVAAATSGTTLQWVGARALEAASDGELCKVEIIVFPFYPAIA